MRIFSNSFVHRGPIPAEFAFGKPGDASAPIALSDNRNPHLAWENAPQGTASFVLWCVDADVPSRPDDANQAGRQLDEHLPRIEFTHWIMVDVPPASSGIAAGSLSDGIVARGKPAIAGPQGARQGRNDFTGWFAGDPDMEGNYHGYDGPCPPFNDARVHRYFFRLFALDVPRLDVPDGFTAAQVLAAMHGHVLDETAIYGTCTLNPALRG